jgi:hypothetical protein
MLTEKAGTLVLQGEKKNRSGAAKRRARRAQLQRLLLGTLPAARFRLHGGPVHPGSRVKRVKNHWGRGLVHMGSNLRKVVSLCQVLASARDPLAAHLRAADKEAQEDWATELCQGCSGGLEDGHHL